MALWLPRATAADVQYAKPYQGQVLKAKKGRVKMKDVRVRHYVGWIVVIVFFAALYYLGRSGFHYSPVWPFFLLVSLIMIVLLILALVRLRNERVSPKR